MSDHHSSLMRCYSFDIKLAGIPSSFALDIITVSLLTESSWTSGGYPKAGA